MCQASVGNYQLRLALPLRLTRATTKNVENNALALLAGQLEQTSLLYEIKQGAAVKVDPNPAENYSQKHLWLVPIGRNLAFVGRYTVMKTLEDQLMPIPDSIRTAALYGLGGVG